jgi:hypothetical protein
VNLSGRSHFVRQRDSSLDFQQMICLRQCDTQTLKEQIRANFDSCEGIPKCSMFFGPNSLYKYVHVRYYIMEICSTTIQLVRVYQSGRAALPRRGCQGIHHVRQRGYPGEKN